MAWQQWCTSGGDCSAINKWCEALDSKALVQNEESVSCENWLIVVIAEEHRLFQWAINAVVILEFFAFRIHGAHEWIIALAIVIICRLNGRHRQ